MSALPALAVLTVALMGGRKKKGAAMPEATTSAAPPSPSSGWTTYGSPVLTESMRVFLDALAARLGRRLVVTSGVRTPEAQARAMLAKLAAGEDLHALYKADDLVDELLEASPRDLPTWTRIIESQVARGRLLSDHQSGQAVDIDDRDAAGVPLDKSATLAAAAELGAEGLYEDIRSHYHFEEIPNA